MGFFVEFGELRQYGCYVGYKETTNTWERMKNYEGNIKFFLLPPLETPC